MIPADLLIRLREKDPDLWGKYKQWSAHMDIYDETALQYILQGELQEAIRAHRPDYIGTWFYNLEYVEVGRIEAKIFNRAGIISEGVADTEAEALLRAYLSALSGERI